MSSCDIILCVYSIYLLLSAVLILKQDGESHYWGEPPPHFNLSSST